ncbi:MAG: DUF4307 domain-containing protein [Cellulomonadaceae bacterium]
MTSPAPVPPPDRYGTRPASPARRRAGRIVLWTAAGLGTALAAWSGWSMVASQPFTTQEVGFSVQSPEVIEVTFNVTKSADVTLQCTITALNSSYGEVGSRSVTIGPGSGQRESFTIDVRTSELATTGVVDSCEVVEG